MTGEGGTPIARVNDARVPRPRRKLLRTWFKLPRAVKPFHQPLSFEQLYNEPVAPDELAHWGRMEVLDDLLILLHRDGTTTYRTHYIAALHSSGDLKEFEQLNVVYRHGWRRPRIKSWLHLPDGARKKGTVQDGAIDNAGTRQLVVTHTHLRPGVVLDYVMIDDHFRPSDVVPGIWGEYWLHTRWPCKRRRLTIGVAEPFELTLRLEHGATQPDQSRVGGGYTVYRWELSNTPGLEPEPWMAPPADFCALVDYSTIPSWQPIAEYFRKELDPHCVAGHGSWADTRKIIGDASSDREKVARVYDFACSDVRYGRPAREMEQRTVRSGSRIAEDLQGDCKDKSALMASMLREVNVPTDIAVVLTTDNGVRRRLPGPRFDHAVAVAHVDGEELWLDAAPGVFSMGVIPHPNQGAGALLLRQDGRSEYLRVPAARPADHGITRACHGAIDAEGNYRYHSTTEFTGERAAQMRSRLADRNAEARKRLLQFVEAEIVPGAQVEDVRAEGDDNLTGGVTMTATALLPNLARPLKDLLLLRLPWAEVREMTGILSATTRQVPLVALPPATSSETLEIDLPSEYAAYGLPWEKVERCPWSNYRGAVRMGGHRLIATRQIEDHPPASFISPDEYPAFRAFWSRCAQGDAMDVVLFRGESPF